MGGLNYPEETLRVPNVWNSKSKKVVCELPLISASLGQNNWWTEGIGMEQKGTGCPKQTE